MIPIRDTDVIAQKWADVTPGRTSEYEAVIQAPLKDWEKNTVAGRETYRQGMLTAAQNDSFNRGVQASSDEHWQSQTLEKGVQRWIPGLQAGVADYEAGYLPYREIIARLTLPQRYAVGDPRNIDRVKVIAEALYQARELLKV